MVWCLPNSNVSQPSRQTYQTSSSTLLWAPLLPLILSPRPHFVFLLALTLLIEMWRTSIHFPRKPLSVPPNLSFSVWSVDICSFKSAVKNKSVPRESIIFKLHEYYIKLRKEHIKESFIPGVVYLGAQAFYFTIIPNKKLKISSVFIGMWMIYVLVSTVEFNKYQISMQTSDS